MRLWGRSSEPEPLVVDPGPPPRVFVCRQCGGQHFYAVQKETRFHRVTEIRERKDGVLIGAFHANVYFPANEAPLSMGFSCADCKAFAPTLNDLVENVEPVLTLAGAPTHG